MATVEEEESLGSSAEVAEVVKKLFDSKAQGETQKAFDIGGLSQWTHHSS